VSGAYSARARASEPLGRPLASVDMARVFITGSADGLGRAAAQTLLNHGPQVVIHAPTRDRLTAAHQLPDRGPAGVVGDLSDSSRRAVSPAR
jgi:NAD(P)-dependent dehydrogenase (short-subunit alcohol dehydrogenase family)